MCANRGLKSGRLGGSPSIKCSMNLLFEELSLIKEAAQQNSWQGTLGLAECRSV
jgi:hypothetical protein